MTNEQTSSMKEQQEQIAWQKRVIREEYVNTEKEQDKK